MHIPWRCLLALLAGSLSEAGDCEAPSLLQLRNDSNIVASLIGAQKFCFEGREGCLEHLKKYRALVWPQVALATNGTKQHAEVGWWPKPFGPWDSMVRLPCKDQEGEVVVFYRHIWKSAGHAIRENLKQVPGSRSQSARPHEVCNYVGPNVRKHFLFTFVREPISRFVSAYAEIEGRVRLDNPNYANLSPILKPFEFGSLKRAEAFFQEFLKHGIHKDGHVKPQMEYLGSNPECTDAMDFIGHAENLTGEWSKMLDAMPCQAGQDAEAFQEMLGEHPNDPKDKDAAAALLKLGNPTPAALMQLDAASEVQRLSMASMQQMLGKSPESLKALCWIYLPDFVAFGYDLPQPCQEDSTLQSIFLRSRH